MIFTKSFFCAMLSAISAYSPASLSISGINKPAVSTAASTVYAVMTAFFSDSENGLYNFINMIKRPLLRFLKYFIYVFTYDAECK